MDSTMHCIAMHAYSTHDGKNSARDVDEVLTQLTV